MKVHKLILFFVFISLSVGLVACEEAVQNNSDDRPKAEDLKEASKRQINNEINQKSHKEVSNNLSRGEIIKIVESVNPNELKPSMTAEERIELRKKLYSSLTEEEIRKLSVTIIELSMLLTGTVADELYKNLIDTNDPKWSILEQTKCYYAREKLENVKHLVTYQPLLDDLNIVIKLCEEGVDQRNILKIVDAKRILQDISHHFLQVPYTGPGEEIVDFGDKHKLYFKSSKTLEGSHNLISD